MNPFKAFDRSIMLLFPTIWKSRIHLMILISPFIITPIAYFLAENADLISLFKDRYAARDTLSSFPLLFGIIIGIYWLSIQNRFPLYMSFNFFSTLGLIIVNIICLCLIFLPIAVFSYSNLEQLAEGSGSYYIDDYEKLLFILFHFIIIPFAVLAVFINQFSFQEFLITIVLGALGGTLAFLLLITIVHEENVAMTSLILIGGGLTFYTFQKYLRNVYTKRIKQITLLILAFVPWIVLEIVSLMLEGRTFIDRELKNDILMGTSILTIILSAFLLWFFQRKIRRPEVVN